MRSLLAVLVPVLVAFLGANPTAATAAESSNDITVTLPSIPMPADALSYEWTTFTPPSTNGSGAGSVKAKPALVVQFSEKDLAELEPLVVAAPAPVTLDQYVNGRLMVEFELANAHVVALGVSKTGIVEVTFEYGTLKETSTLPPS